MVGLSCFELDELCVDPTPQTRMTHAYHPQFAPCIVDTGIVVQRRDIQRLLCDLGRVRYQDILDDQIRSQGEGYVMEVFEDPVASTLVVNRTLYLNIHSFDYLAISQRPDDYDPQQSRSQFDLVQENRILRLIPLSDPLSDPLEGFDDTQALKAAMADALAAEWEEEGR